MTNAPDSLESMTNTIAIISLVVSVISALIVAYFSAWITFRNDRKSRNQDKLRSILEDCYSPIMSMLIENSILYTEFGPNTFQGRSVEISTALGERWNSIKKAVIIPNLQSIRALIQKKWIASEAKDKKYLQELLIHCTAFCEYESMPTEMYAKYKYQEIWKEKLNEDISILVMEISK